MKLLAIFLFALGLQTFATGYSQTVTLSLKNTPVKKVFKEIMRQTGVSIVYNEKNIQLNERVDINVKFVPLEKALELCLKNKPYKFTLQNNTVFVTREFTSPPAVSQGMPVKPVLLEISGKVTNEEGFPLSNVSIVIKGTDKGVVTDVNGNFSINVPDENGILVFSYVGYHKQEIKLGQSRDLSVILSKIDKEMDDIVVVAYGTQQKVNMTGAVSTLNGKKLSGQVPTSVTSLLQGRLPGVFVTQSSGQPGKPNNKILIRGLGTMNNSNPMVIIDGIESTMDDINPDDVESVNVLKDAASAAIYGTRAANGVVLITTKRGGKGDIKVNYNPMVGWQKAVRLPEHVSSVEYARLLNEANRNQGLAESYTEEEIEKFRTGSDPINYPNTDWMKILLDGSGFTQNHSVNLSGGTDASRYMISVGYFDQSGLVLRDVTHYRRYNVRINLDSKVNDWLTIGLNSSLSRGENKEPAANLLGTGFDLFFQMANNIPPVYPVKNAVGEYVPFGNQNLVAMVEQGGKLTSKNSHALASIFGEITLAKGLSVKGIMGVDYRHLDNKDHYTQIRFSNGAAAGPSQVRDYLERFSSVNLQSFLNYARSIKKHDIKALLGVSRQTEQYNTDQLYRRDFPSNLLDQIDAGSILGATNNGTSRQIKQGSYFGRINYNYDERYLFEANVRRDGSSKFAADYRWGVFPSFSVGWRLSQEHFMQNVDWVNNLKLRGSWGKLGNHNIADYLYMGRIDFGLNYPFGGNMTSGAAQTKANVPDIQWETTTEWNIGLDVDLFRSGMLSGSIDYYNRLTEDILTNVPVSMVFGLPAPTVNAGAMRNRGVEVLLSHTNAIREFTYRFSGNVAFNKNSVEKYPKPSLGAIWGYRYDGTSIRKEGESWDSFYGYENIGIFQSDEEANTSPIITGTPVKAGDLKFRDQDGNGEIDSKDRVVLGNIIPKITYGFTVDLGYKNFDLTAFFQGVAKVYNTMGIMSMFPFKDGGTAFKMHLDRTVIQDGKVIQQGRFPRTLIGGDSHHNAVFSSFWVSDASYLRMKNLQVGYTIPARITERIKLAKVRLYVSGQNLLTFSRFPKSYDPEIIAGYSHWSYPQVQFYSFGANVSF